MFWKTILFEEKELVCCGLQWIWPVGKIARYSLFAAMKESGRNLSTQFMRKDYKINTGTLPDFLYSEKILLYVTGHKEKFENYFYTFYRSYIWLANGLKVNTPDLKRFFLANVLNRLTAYYIFMVESCFLRMCKLMRKILNIDLLINCGFQFFSEDEVKKTFHALHGFQLVLEVQGGYVWWHVLVFYTSLDAYIMVR